ncbi:MAG: chemotaxis protein CheB, partial [Halothece sp. Uz-M2-17]|nr:chemotaxis protein CheB [Halothece sp. Uz-M2-17]
MSEDQTEIHPTVIVAICASEKDIAELQTFFHSIPQDLPASFIILEAASDSLLIDSFLIQEQWTRVQTVSDGTELAINTIYLVPTGQYFRIESNYFQQVKLDSKSLPLPINYFLSSLATEVKERAIGIIFSSVENDGLKGLQTIREKGGFAFIQETESDNNATSLIAPEIADQVLPIAQIVEQVIQIIQTHEYQVDSDFSDLPNISSEQIQEILSILSQRENLDFSYCKIKTLKRRIYRRCSLGGYFEIDHYLTRLKTLEEERLLLKNDLTIGVTRFFRDPEAWDYLQKTILPQYLHDMEEGQEFRAWVTACSTGEEAYSLAIILDELREELGKKLIFKIFATDLDDVAITT